MRTPTPDSVADAVKTLLAGPDPATAVVAGNNRVAVHLLRALAHAERRPAMISFDDFELADLLDPRSASSPTTWARSAKRPPSCCSPASKEISPHRERLFCPCIS